MVQKQAAASAGAKTSLFTRPFVLLCLTMFLAYANQWVITPTIPLYVHDLGGSAFLAGAALLAFSVPKENGVRSCNHVAPALFGKY